MRSPDAALGSTDLTNALGAHTVQTYYDVVSPVTVATARINQSSFAYSLISLTVDTTSGWSSVAVGMDVWIGSSAGLSDIGLYRLKGSDSTHLIIGETAEGDAGLLIRPLRTGAFADNQYITIVQRRSISSVYPLIVGNTFYEDYDVGLGAINQYPQPIVSIKLTTSKITQYNHIWTFVDDGVDYATITFLASASDWPGVATTTTAWTVPGAFTVTGGSIATNTFTAQVPSSVTNYEVTCVVHSDHGAITTRIIEVWSKARSGVNAPMTMSALSRVSWNQTGAALSFALNDNLLSTIPDGSMVVIAQDRLFNGAVIQTAVSQFVGWVTRIGQTTEPGLKSASPEFMTVDGLLSLKRGTSQVWEVVNTVDTWQKVPASLSFLSYAMWWMLNQRARGVVELFDFIPASLTASGQRLPRIDVKMATLWQQLTSLADGHQKRQIGCDPDGTIWVSRHPSLNPTYPRTSGAVVVRDIHDASIYHDIDWPRELFPKVGIVEGSAFSWDGSSVLPTPLLSTAPGFTPGQGANDQKCENQVVDSQSTLNSLTGNYLAFLNPDYPDVTVNYQGMRGSLIKPAQMPLVHLQIPAYLSPSGVALDRYAIPNSVDETYNADQTVDSSVHYTFETTGVAGRTKPVPPPNNSIYNWTTSVGFTPPVDTTQGRVPLWNGTDILPTRLIIFDSVGANCHVAISWSPASGSISYVDVSTGLTGYNIWATADPYNYGRYFALQSTGLYRNENPFAGGSWSLVADNNTLFGNSGRIGKFIAGSINRRGYFAILCGTHYIYTTDYGSTWHDVDILGGSGVYATALGTYADFAISPYNNGSVGWVYASISDIYTGSDNTVLRSTDWGATWSVRNNTAAYLGALNIPYIRVDGSTANINDTSQELYTAYHVANESAIHLSKSAGTSWAAQWHVNAGGNYWTPPQRGQSFTGWWMQTFTYDGKRISFAGTDNATGAELRTAISNDQGATRLEQLRTGGSDQFSHHINRYPVHSQAHLSWTRALTNMYWSIDDGANWVVGGAPSGYTGVSYVEWSIGLLVPPA